MDAPSSICTEGPAPGAAGGIVAFSTPNLVTHYWSRAAFLEEDQLIREASADPSKARGVFIKTGAVANCTSWTMRDTAAGRCPPSSSRP